MLNEVEKYKEFPGRNVDQMPKLIAEGRVPMSVAGLMRRRTHKKPMKGLHIATSGYWLLEAIRLC